MMKRLAAQASVLAVLLACASGLQAGGGIYKKLHVTPVPRQVTVDGDLADWDLSGQIRTYVVPETADMMSGRFAMMYDAKALYISGVVRDTSPMMNRHDPKTDPRKAWDADVCQIFISLDPDEKRPLPYSSFNKAHAESPVATMMLWYYTDDKEPCLSMYRGMGFSTPIRPDLHKEGVIPKTHFDGAYRQSADGRGYTFEYRIPWETMTVKRVPRAGDTLAAVVAAFWGRLDGLKTAGGAAWVYEIMSSPGFPFQQANCWGDLVFHEKGNVPREVVDAGLPPQKPLPLKFAYDLPEDGEVTVQLFDENSQSVRILVPQQPRSKGKNVESWDGLDAAGRPLPPGTYTVKMITHAPITWEYRLSVHNSGKPPYPTDDNRGGWGGDHGTPTTVCRVPGGMVLAWNGCEFGWGIIKVDNQGRKQWGTKYCAEVLATDGRRLFVSGGHSFSGQQGVAILDLRDSRPMNLPGGGASFLPPPGGSEEADHVSGLTYGNGKLYVAFGKRDLVAIHDATSGKLLATWQVKAPGRIAMAGDGTLAVITDGKVVAMKDGKATDWISSDLDEPVGVVVGQDGTVYVANRGDLQNVSVFSKEGKYLRSLGIRGGRPATGRYNPAGTYMPGGIDLDSDGRLWMAETTDGPKRHSVWDTKTGKLADEFFGGSNYFGYGFIDPATPNIMYAHYVLWQIDWQDGAGYPLTTIWRKTSPNMMEAPSSSGYSGVMKIITADNGRQYAWGNAQHKCVLMRRDGDLFRPFASVMHIGYGWSLYRGLGIPLLDDDKERYKNGDYFWQDRNDDQTVQADEVLQLTREQGRPGFVWLEKDLRMWTHTGRVLKPVKIRGNGQPVYDMAKAQDTFLTGKRGFGHGYFARDEAGNTYTFATGNGPCLVKWSPDGKMLWSYNDLPNWHSALSMPIVDKGRLWGMSGLMGIAGDFFAHQTYFGPNHIFDLDGVYVGMVLRDGRVSGSGRKDGSGTDAGQPEGQNGQFVKLTLDGKERYFVIHGGQDSRVWEVLGLDTVKALPSWQFTLKTEEAKIAKAAYDAYQKAITRDQKMVVVAGRRNLHRAEPVQKVVDSRREFTAKAAYDADALTVQFDVKTDCPLANAESDPKILFRGGNVLDIQIATDPEADAKRKKPVPGDIRLLVTRKAGKPFAVLYRPKVKGFAGKPIVLTSPTGSESFDSIEVVEAVGLSYRERAGGFTATVTIPQSLLGGLKLAKGARVMMDVGYVFGNKGGTRAAARAYWRNNSFTANVTNDIPHESRLEPAEWGEAGFE